MANNSRLDSALSHAKTIAPAKKNPGCFTSKTARAAALSKPRKMATGTVRVHTDAIELARRAWSKEDRINETSEAIREAAKSALGIS